MNATESAALVSGLDLYDEMNAVVEERTLESLDRRRRAAVVRRRRGWIVRRALLLADVVGLLVAMCFSEWLTARGQTSTGLDTRLDILVFVVSMPAWVVVAKLYGLYDRDEERADHASSDDFGRVFHMLTVCTWSFALLAQLTHVVHPSMTKLALFWATAIVLVGGLRATARALVRRRPAYLQNTVIVGAGEVGQTIAKKLLGHPEYRINVVGFVDSEPKERSDDLGHLALLGGPERLPSIVRLLDVERVIIAFSNESHDETLDTIRSLKLLEVQIDIVPRLFELVGPGVGIHNVEGLPLVGLPPFRLSRSSKLLKRLMDAGLATAALVVFSPVLLAAALALKLDSKGPVFFRQTRMGAGGEPFAIWKFRSMVAGADELKEAVAHLNRHVANDGDPRMFKIPDDPRVTRVGRVLRRYCIDELPQLFNVVVGQMSLVGPRPLILDEDEHVAAWGRERLNLKPGITGPWQVLGASAIPFFEMVRLDYLYVTSWSLGRDLSLLARTVPIVFKGRPDERAA